jgi:branched-chain amino acid aminotransferase
MVFPFPIAGLDVITPPLDGTILPGVTRASVIDLCSHFNSLVTLRQFAGMPELVSSFAPSTQSSPSSPSTILPSLDGPDGSSTVGEPGTLPKLHVHEAAIYLTDLERFNNAGALVEAFGAGTAAVICPVGRIGVRQPCVSPSSSPCVDGEGDGGVVTDIVLPEYEGGLGPVGGAMYRALVAIQEGRVEVDHWSVTCD